MRTAHAKWIAESLCSVAALAWIFSLADEEAHSFFYAELALLAIAFLAALLSGRPGRVLLIGVGLGFAVATVLAMAASGCSEDDIICFGPGLTFVLGLILAGALYPGWALGTGLGALARLETRRRQQT